MKKIICLALLFCLSCSTQTTRLPSSEKLIENLSPTESKFSNDIFEFQQLVEEALVWRAKSLKFLEQQKENLKQKNQLSHEAMLQIFEAEKQYIPMRQKFINYIDKYRFPANTTEVKFMPGKGSKIVNYEHNEYDTNYVVTHSVIIDPNDDLGKELIIKMKLYLASATILYDNYLIGIYPLEEHRKPRRLLNLDNPKERKELEKLTDNFFDLSSRIEFLTALKVFNKVKKYSVEHSEFMSSQHKYLNELILSSPVFNFMQTGNDLKNQPNIIFTFANRLYDRARFIFESFSYFTSMTFGNTVGTVASRKGLLKSISEGEKNDIENSMLPLDILLEKTPFRLTDKFIPGYYGHVAIWIGNKEQLQKLDLWDHPLIAKYHAEIESGHHIIEALRPGVEINTLDHFLDIDDLLVLRAKELTLDQKREYIIRSFEQIGKEYDFNFDVETDNRIVCSEIVYVVFHNIKWPTSKTLGRYTISPDNVAVKGLKNGMLEPKLIYRSGVKQTGDLTQVLEDILEN